MRTAVAHVHCTELGTERGWFCKVDELASLTAAEMVALAESLLSGRRGSWTDILISEMLPLIEAVKSSRWGAGLDVA